jgi:ribosomal protein S18 acetylase RimI-like enzyme
MMIIRRLKIEELDDIQALYAQQAAADEDPLSQIQISPKQHAWEMRRIRQQWLTEQRYLVYVAEDEENSGKIVGYATALIDTQARMFKVGTMASITELWVLPEYRKRGIGKALMEELFAAIDNQGIEWITVHISGNNPDTRRFFDKIGFRQNAVEMQVNLNDIAQEA